LQELIQQMNNVPLSREVITQNDFNVGGGSMTQQFNIN
jgi:hypothetical protein